MEDCDPTTLPPLLAEIAEVIGLPLALKLAAECGGTYVYISTRPRADNAAARVIGLEAMRKLGKHFGAGLIEMPVATSVHRSRRNALIRRSAKLGLSQSQLARRYNLTVRHIRRICSPGSDDERQLDMFGGFDSHLNDA